ncbi:BLUF domain-containing protein [Oceanicoccus sp. KOV_DT_Chl]|uniref:BLUF domain-containing protein n=1 Tax=Oceanicoccus sp. KOV_DT_Chl TaxID=1904639 RepID=UPI000C7AF21B|nr:BLUF domain-containing protein [Oceanicoccus sp. KOV_DT_Chl]
MLSHVLMEPQAPMIHLIYSSHSHNALSAIDVENILKSSHRNNRQLNITGILLYQQDLFLQVLEGPDDAVRERFEIIKQDPRHDKVEVLQEYTISQRDFPDWAMGFKQIGSHVSPALLSEARVFTSLADLIPEVRNEMTRDYLSSFQRLLFS